jgi:hypothetical protein
MNVSRVGGGARLRGVLRPFRLRPTEVETAIVHPATGGATASSAWADFIVTTPPERERVLISGSGSFAAAACSLSGVMEVGPDPKIAILHREDEELLLLLV